jgi:hypothetical protein
MHNPEQENFSIKKHNKLKWWRTKGVKGGRWWTKGWSCLHKKEKFMCEIWAKSSYSGQQDLGKSETCGKTQSPHKVWTLNSLNLFEKMKLGMIKKFVILKLSVKSHSLAPINPLLQWYSQSKKILLNLSMKCWNSAFNAQSSRIIIVVVQIGAVKIYVAAVEALRKKERGDETQYTTQNGGKTSLCPSFIKFQSQLRIWRPIRSKLAVLAP